MNLRNCIRSVVSGLLLVLGTVYAGAQETELQMVPEQLVPDAVEVRDVELSRFGSFVAIYDLTEGNAIRLFDSSLNQLWRRRLPYYWAGSLDAGSVLQFAPDESFVLFPGGRTENDICVCDPLTGTQIDILQAHEEEPGVLALSRDGRLLFSASRNELMLWQHGPDGFDMKHAVREYGPYVHSAEFLPDGRLLVSTTEQMVRTITVYDVSELEFTHVFRHHIRDNNISHDIDQFAVAPDGQFAAGYRDRILVFDSRGPEVVLTDEITDIDVGNVQSLTWSPDGRYIVSGHFRFVKWWSYRGSEWVDVRTSETQQPVPNDLEISEDAASMYVGSRADENALSRFSLTGVEPSDLGAIAGTVGGLSEAQRRVLSPDLASSIMNSVGRAAVAPRDMFETAAEYDQRLVDASLGMREAILSAVEERYEVVRTTGEGGLSDVSIPLQSQGSYDIDRIRYSVRFMDTDAWLTIEREAARDLFRGWSGARIVATRYMRDDQPAYADFRLLHPDEVSVYPLVLDVNPFTGERINPARSLLPSAPVGPDVSVQDLEIDGIFPALYAQYADHPLGRFTIVNNGTGIISDLRAGFSIGGLTEQGRTIDLPSSLAAGRTVTAELVAPVSSDILKNSDGGTAAFTLSVSYRRGETYSTDITRQIRVLNRNAIQWTDDRRLGAFMTVSNPVVLGWGAETAGSVTENLSPVLTRNFLYALTIYESLATAGLQYVIDPNSAYASLSADSAAVDFLRFPAETLDHGAGDCDDLSVLYATLLESVGVSTAFITTPGHIFVAFDTGSSEDEARALFAERENLIYREGRAWMPIETTVLAEGFTRAWQTGALQWRQAVERNVAGFFTAQEAWERHAPVTPGISVITPSPHLEATGISAARQLDAFRDIELTPKLQRLDGESESAAVRNQRGVLYATYGLLQEAASEFENALTGDEYVPALINQANVLSVMGRHADAREYLERARSVAPENPRVLLGLAFSHWENGNRDEARDTYAEASRASPSLARRFPLFSDSDSTARAGHVESVFTQDWVSD